MLLVVWCGMVLNYAANKRVYISLMIYNGGLDLPG